MVAIVSGQSLGLFNTSANILGAAGILGNASFGQAPGRAFVNAATGNLILRFSDEVLSGRGADLQHVRTYNSLGQMTDGDNDGWRWQGERTVRFDAAQNKVIRTGSDGADIVYSFDGGSRYVSTDGDGAHDFIRRDGTQWVWTDGYSRLEERYGDSTSLSMIGRLQTQKDTSGNLIQFEYDTSGRLIRVRDQGSAQRIELTYQVVGGGFTRLTRVETFELAVDSNGRALNTLSGTPIKQVEYTYNNGRLATVRTVLDPSAAELAYYTTTYTYADSTSTKITSITQSDGTRVDFTYYLDGRIETVTDGDGEQKFIYSGNTATIEIRDAAGENLRAWTYTYAAQTRQLLQVDSPPPVAGGARIVARFEYDSAGNVTRVFDGRGNAVTYAYDAQGNRTSERDALDNAVTRTYNDKNQIVTESRYTSTGTDAADALTTRYVYDAQSRLRFSISAEGRVQEYRYGTGTGEFGLLTRSIQYVAGRYDLSELSVNEAPVESTLVAWAGAQDRSKVQLTQYAYDFRGNLATCTEFATVDSAGEGVIDASTVVTDSIYDGHGNLLQTIARRGSPRTQASVLTSYIYDGLGRITREVNAGGSRTFVYDVRSVLITNVDSGLVELRQFDVHGRLTDVRRDTSAWPSADARNTRNVYDSFGLLRMVQDPLGNRQFNFYDTLGRLLQHVDSGGTVTSYEYDANGGVTSQTRHATRIAQSVMNSWVTSVAVPQSNVVRLTVNKQALTVGTSNTDVLTHADDRTISYVYDEAGRLKDKVTVDSVTTNVYDSASRVIEQYETGNNQGEVRTIRYFHDADGLRVGMVDALGYLTEYKYDAAKRLTDTIRYSSRSPAMANVSAPVWIGVIDQAAVGGKFFEYALRAVDADGDALTYQRLSGPSWLTLDTSVPGRPVLRGTPPKTLATHTVVMQASDGRGKTTNITMNIVVGNTPPAWARLPDATVSTGTQNFSLTLPVATDNEGGTLTYSVDSELLPPGLSFSVNSGVPRISGTPTIAGSYAITIRVQDAGSPPLFTERTFVLQVTNRGPSWPITGPREVTATRMQALNFQVPVASDPEGGSLTYRLVHGPSWLRFDTNTRSLTGTPPANTPVGGPGFVPPAAVLEAQDSHGAIVRVALTVNVQNAAPTWPATLPVPTPQHAGTQISYLLPAATDPEGAAITYQAFGLPPGVTVNGRTISGRSGAIGTFVVTVTATDPEGGTISRQITIVQTNSAPVFQGVEWGPFESGEPADLEVLPNTFIDPDGDRIVYSASPNGPLPGGFRFLANGPNGNPWFLGIAGGRNNTFMRFGLVATDILPDGSPGTSREVVIQVRVVVFPGPGKDTDATLIGGDDELSSTSPIDVLADWRPTTTNGLRTRAFYDGAGRQIGAVDEKGFLTETVYDEAANKQHTLRYSTALTVSEDDTLATLKSRAGTAKTATVQFDALGRVSTSTAVDGTVTRNEYDDAGRLIRQVAADGTDEARGRSIRYNEFGEVTGTLGGTGDAWLSANSGGTLEAIERFGVRYEYDRAGRQILAIDANGTDRTGNRTRFFYDKNGRLTHTLNAKGEVSETRYNAFGEVAATRRYDTRFDVTAEPFLGLMSGTVDQPQLIDILQGMTVADKDRLVSYEYDRSGQVTEFTDAMGLTTSNTYTDFRELRTQVRQILAAAGNQAAVTTSTQFDYSLRGELLSITRDLGGINDNDQIAYDAFGRVVARMNGAGKVTTTGYLDSGRTIVVTDPLNRSISTEYDTFARVLKTVDARGQQTTYAYDEDSRSFTVTTPEGVLVTTTRNRHGETSSVVDGLGNTASYEYDKGGRLTKVNHTETSVTGAPVKVLTENKYDDAGHLIEAKDARGTVTMFSYDAVHRMFKREVDPTGLNLVTTYKFSAFGQQILVTEGEGSSSPRVTGYSYDQDGRVIKQIVDPNGLALTTSYGYDGLGQTVLVARGSVSNANQHVTQYVYDKAGRRTAEIVAPSSILGAGSTRERDLTTEFRYDAAGRVSRRIDANGQSTRFIYNDANELTHTISAAGEVVENFYNKNGHLARTHAYATRISASTLAGFGDVVSASQVTLAATDKDQRSYFVYNKDGQLGFTLRAELDDNWSIREQRFDAVGNVIEQRFYDKLLKQARIDAIDDAEGGITAAEIAGELNTLGYTNEASLASIQRTRHAYDSLNRLRFVVDATGAVTESIFDAAGNKIASARYAARPTLTAYTERAIDAAVDRASIANQVAHFAYDKAGRLRYTVQELANDKQRVTEQKYDALGRVVETRLYSTMLNLGDLANDAYTVESLASSVVASNADHRTASVYDDADRKIYSVLALGADAQGQLQYRMMRHVYDSVGRQTQATVYATAVGDFSKAALDAAVTAQAANADNRTTSYIYDEVGRERFVVRADRSLTERVYDALGQVIEERQFDLTVPAGMTANGAPPSMTQLVALRAALRVGDGTTRGRILSYDPAGRMISATDARNANDSVESYTYDAFGNRASYTDKKGSTRTYTYDAAGRLRTETLPSVLLRLSGQTTAQSVQLQTMIEYDAFGNIERRVEARGTAEERITLFGYDKLNRLTSTTASSVQMMLSDRQVKSVALQTLLEYDAVGNLRKRTEAAGTVDQRVTQYEHDALGRETKVTLPGFYDPKQGKVVATATNDSFARTLETTYDTFGNIVRTKLRKGAGSNDFQYQYRAYDVLDRVIYDVDALANVTRFTYNALGDQTAVTRFSMGVGSTTASNGLWSSGDLTTALAADTKSRTVTTLYDTMGRKREVKLPGFSGNFYAGSPTTVENAGSVSAPGSALSPTTEYHYNTFGDLDRESIKLDATGSDISGRNGHWRDTWHYFDVLGRESATIDAAGYRTDRTYDANGNLKTTTQYANAGATGSVLMPDNVPPALPQLSENDRITEFLYNELNQQTSIKRYGLSYATRSATPRDGYDRINNARDVGITVASMTYDSMGHVRSMVDALGNETVTSYDKLGRITQIVEPGRLVASGSSVDPFRNQVIAKPTTAITLDAFGQVMMRVRTSGIAAGAPQAAGATLTTRQFYDHAGNLIAVEDANGNRRSMEVDYAGRVIAEKQNIDVNLSHWRTTSHVLERRYGYDAAGRRTEVVDVYTDAAGVRQQSGQRQVLNAFGELIEEHRIFGAASSTFASLSSGILTKYDYDSTGHLTGKIAVDGVTTYFYDLAGQMTRQEARGLRVSGSGTVTATGAPAVSETGYDILGRARRLRLESFMTNISGATPSEVRITPIVEQFFDRWGNVTKRYQGDFGYNGELRTDARRITSYEYDDDNRVTAQHLPTAQAMTAGGRDYFANLIHQTSYDLMGRLVFERDTIDNADTPTVEDAYRRHRFKEYDAAGQLFAETDYAGAGTIGARMMYAYDANGARIGTRNALGTVFVDEVDSNGNVLRHSVLRLSDGTTAYDSRTAGTTGHVPVALTLNLYQYDQANRRVASAQHFKTLVEGIGTAVLDRWTYTSYDERNYNRETFEITHQLPELGRSDIWHTGRLTQRCSYDEFGNKLAEEDANRILVNDQDTDKSNDRNTRNWTYSRSLNDYTVGRLSSFVAGNRTTQQEYDERSRLAKETYTDVNNPVTTGRTMSRSYAYNDNGLLKHIQDVSVLGPGLGFRITETTRYDYTVHAERGRETFTHQLAELDENGEVANVTEGSRETKIFYDEAGRINEVVSPTGYERPSQLEHVHYDYDELGNQRRISAIYRERAGQLATLKQTWYDYDAAGRLKIVDGALLDGAISEKRVGATLIHYDAAGRRSSAERFMGRPHRPQDTDPEGITHEQDEYREELYVYDDLGHLELWQRMNLRNIVVHSGAGQPDSSLPDSIGESRALETRNYDSRGELTQRMRFSQVRISGNHIEGGALRTTTDSWYQLDGRLARQKTTVAHRPDDTTELTYQYDEVGNVKSYDYRQNEGRPGDFLNRYLFEYNTLFGGYRQSKMTLAPLQGNQTGGMTVSEFDWRGNVSKQIITDAGVERRLFFSYDANGQIVAKRQFALDAEELQGTQDFTYVNGRLVAQIGSGALSDTKFFDSYVPVSEAALNAPGTYVVGPIDTLGSIAQAVYGDAQFWYIIAEANSIGTGPDEPLPGSEIGKTYRIPNVLANNRNHATTSRPYNPAEIIGSNMPSSWALPPVDPCRDQKAFLVQAVTMAVTIVVTAALTYVSPPTAALNAGVGAAAGNLVGQWTADGVNLYGDEEAEKVDWFGVARAGVQGAITAQLAQGLSGSISSPAARAAIASGSREFVNQVPNGFEDWRSLEGIGTSLARVGMAAAAAQAIGSPPQDQLFNWRSVIGSMTADAMDPRSGWIFNDAARTWQSIAGQAFSAVMPVIVNGLVKESEQAPGVQQVTYTPGAATQNGSAMVEIASVREMVLDGVDPVAALQQLKEMAATDPDLFQFDAGTGALLQSQVEVIEVKSSPTLAWQVLQQLGGAAKSLGSLADRVLGWVPSSIPLTLADRYAAQEAARNELRQMTHLQIDENWQDRKRDFIDLVGAADHGLNAEQFHTVWMRQWADRVRAAEAKVIQAVHENRDSGPAEEEHDAARSLMSETVTAIELARAADAYGRPYDMEQFDAAVAKLGGIRHQFSETISAMMAVKQFSSGLRLPIARRGAGETTPRLSADESAAQERPQGMRWHRVNEDVEVLVPQLRFGSTSTSAAEIPPSVNPPRMGAANGDVVPRQLIGTGEASPSVFNIAAVGSAGPTQPYSLTKASVLDVLYSHRHPYFRGVADAIRTDRFLMIILPTYPAEPSVRGWYMPGENEFTLVANNLHYAADAAGTAAHETTHWLQMQGRGRSFENYHTGDEFEAVKAQILIDPTHSEYGGLSDSQLQDKLNQKYKLRGVPTPPPGWTPWSWVWKR